MIVLSAVRLEPGVLLPRALQRRLDQNVLKLGTIRSYHPGGRVRPRLVGVRRQGLRAQAQRGQGIRSGSVVVSSVGRQFGAAFTPCKQRAAERRRGLVPAQPTFRRCRAGFTVCCAASISPIGVGQCRTVLGSLANLMCARSTRPMRHGSARPPPLECVGFVNSLIQSRTRITVAGLRPVSLRLDRDSGLARERDRSEMSPRADKV